MAEVKSGISLEKFSNLLLGCILGRKPLPSIRGVFSEVRHEGSRRKIILHNTEPGFNIESESSAPVLRDGDSDNDVRKKPWCNHWKKLWHKRETCWKLYGKPINWKPKSKRNGCAYKVITEETHEPSTNWDAVLLPRSS
ncbi:hypothetical protein OWV82_007854 [Melia azedarach]|uniref:Uncharacterized protein n=1 Tax=Melia azedarach TaxID=155640 RepID=A0ACC1Y861_MELAZ|nr:hypothetical protein OWV82_007854 [Melia azedarach]